MLAALQASALPRCGARVAAILAAALSTAPGTAAAWYFPEHAVIAHEGLAELPPELRAIVRRAVASARSEGMALCDSVDVPFDRVARDIPLTTKMIRVRRSVDCVPYAALPALAGDHADSTRELRAVLTSSKGIEITSAAAYEWGRFQEALDQLPNTSLERMSFVHALDVAFYFVDPGYELRAQATRAHFVDASRRFEDVVRSAGAANLDNALEQFLAHHIRSLELASRGQPTEALLEHAFALHFFEDAFAAGHLIEAGWNIGNERQRRRHDFYNARGLQVERALNREPCDATSLGEPELLGLPPCWLTSGDGYLGLSRDASDRLHASRAMSKAQFQLALALEPETVKAFVATLGEREQLGLGQLIEPTPWWTVAHESRGKLRASAARTVRLVAAAADATVLLRSTQPTPVVEVGKKAPSPFFDKSVLVGAIDACGEPPPSAAPAPLAPVDGNDDVATCGPGRALRTGTVGTSLLRPLLAEWPKPTANAATLQGESKEDLGWAVQLLANTNARVIVPSGAPVEFFAPSIGVAAGLSYRWGTYLPGRLNRAVVELNAGISDSLHYDSALQAGGNPHVTMLDQELRWPIVYELLTSYKLPLDLARGHGAGHVVLLSGIRTHELLLKTPVFWGFEIEALSVALSRGRGAYPLYAASPEVRIYVGMADPQAAQPSLSSKWAPTIGIALSGGYATFL